MNQGFWKQLHRCAQTRGLPIIVLAPMADVTDVAFRRLIAKYGKPDVMWTEFVSADGLCSPGRDILLRDLAFSPEERPIVAQLFTSHPDKMREAATLVQSLGFDGLDINMGCPDRSVEKQGAGAAMIRAEAEDTARAVIRAAHEGAPNLPISVKTRVGYNKADLERWIPALLALDLAVLTIHARTRKEMSDVPANWDYVKRVVEIRDEIQGDEANIAKTGRSHTLIFGNGDVKDLADAEAKAKESGADGVMLGRAIFGNPWLFDRTRHGSDGRSVSIPERLRVLVEHTHLFEELLGDIKNFAVMKKHYKAYVNGWEGAKELRMKLMETTTAAEVEGIVNRYLAI